MAVLKEDTAVLARHSEQAEAKASQLKAAADQQQATIRALEGELHAAGGEKDRLNQLVRNYLNEIGTLQAKAQQQQDSEARYAKAKALMGEYETRINTLTV
jgi:hypothetical protein